MNILENNPVEDFLRRNSISYLKVWNPVSCDLRVFDFNKFSPPTQNSSGDKNYLDVVGFEITDLFFKYQAASKITTASNDKLLYEELQRMESLQGQKPNTYKLSADFLWEMVSN